jgi:hypothetical protein
MIERGDGGDDLPCAPRANGGLAPLPGYGAMIPRGFSVSRLHWRMDTTPDVPGLKSPPSCKPGLGSGNHSDGEEAWEHDAPRGMIEATGVGDGSKREG